MEDRTDSPMAVKVEKHSQYVILTYFQGDINSMVDAHFTRALSKVCVASAPAAKTKKMCKTLKLGKRTKPIPKPKRTVSPIHPPYMTSSFVPTEEASPCQGSDDPYSESQVPPVGHLLTFSPMDDAPDSWHSFTSRPGEGPGLPSIAYSLSPEGLSLTGQQYARSLLNLLHNDHGELGPSMASSSKPELLPSWTVPQGFRESVDPAVGFEPGKPSAAREHL